MFAYKIVGKETRYGTNATMFIGYNRMHHEQFDKLVGDLKIKEYFPRYEKNKIVNSAKGSVGIMCFKTYKEAHNFIIEKNLGDGYDIIKVKGYEKIYDTDNGYTISIFKLNEHFISDIKNKHCHTCIANYLTFNKVKVLE